MVMFYTVPLTQWV